MKIIIKIKLFCLLLILNIGSLCIAEEVPISISLGAEGHDLEYDITRNVIYASVPTLNEIAVIDVATLQVERTISLNAEPRGLDLSIDNSKLYVALNDTGSIGIIELSTDDVSVVVLTELGDLRTWDVEEAETNRLFVSANPGSNGISYIVEVLLDNTGTVLNEQRVAGGQIIRARPVFAINNDRTILYVGAGFSPNSLY